MRQPRPRQSSAGLLEEILRTCRDMAWGSLVDSFRGAVLDLLHEGMILLVGYVVVAVALAAGLVLLASGALHALRTIPLSDAAIYTIVGGFALALGVILLFWLRSRRSPGGR